MLTGKSIRIAVFEDLDKIIDLSSSLDFNLWTPLHYHEEIENPEGAFYVITDDESDSDVFGYCIYRRQSGYIHILSIAVSREWQKKGFAKSLIQQVINDAIKSNIPRVCLEVGVSNNGAIEFYQKSGFLIMRRIKHFYPNQNDAYEMEANLLELNRF